MKHKKSNQNNEIHCHSTDSISQQKYISQLRQQLRDSLQQLEQCKLSSELELQKRSIIDQQCKILKQENSQLRTEVENLRHEFQKSQKKYSKIKANALCKRCRMEGDAKMKWQREREVFIKEREILKRQIEELKSGIESMTKENEETRKGRAGKVEGQAVGKNKIIEEQGNVIRYLDEKLSVFEIQKLQMLSYVEEIDQNLQKVQMENIILKGIAGKEYLDRSRKGGGSFKDLEKIDKVNRSHLGIPKVSTVNY